MMQNYKSPAKINLFLNIIKKRSDGYHDIQSIFQLIELYDEISFKLRKDSQIKLVCSCKNIIKDNLILKAIESFLDYTKAKKIGMNIFLKKNIPIGAGLGGGSSNAATTIKALNEIYNTKLRESQLKTIANSLGKDIEFFLSGKNAWVEGTGDIITPIELKPSWFILIHSLHKVSTSEVFSEYKVRGRPKSFSYDNYLNNSTKNDFESIVFKKYPSIFKSFQHLSKHGKARLTGTGGTVFLSLSSLSEAKKILSCIPKNQNPLIVKSLIT